MDRGAWWAAVHGVTKSWTQLSDFTFTFHFHALEKEMATHSSVLAWRIPGMGEPGGLSSMGSHRVGHDWSDLAAAAPKISQLLLRKSIDKQKWIFKKYNAIHLWFCVNTLLVPVDADTMPNTFCFVLGTDLVFICFLLQNTHISVFWSVTCTYNNKAFWG